MAVGDDWPHGAAYAHLEARRGKGWSGVTVGPGWADIVLWADAELAKLDPDYVIHQVKEKWGGLRYYSTLDGREDADRIIAQAELRAARTCTRCGVEGDQVEPCSISGWVDTLCPRCRGIAGGVVEDDV